MSIYVYCMSIMNLFVDIERLILIVLLLLVRYINIEMVYRCRIFNISCVNSSMVCQYINGMLIHNHHY